MYRGRTSTRRQRRREGDKPLTGFGVAAALAPCVLLLIMLVGALPCLGDEVVMLKTALFTLDAGDGWKEDAPPEPDVHILHSDKNKVSATISAQAVVQDGMDVMEVKAIAERLLEIRTAAETQVLREAGIDVSLNRALKQLSFGYQIEYFGHDSDHRQFRYFGVVTPTKVVNIYLESYDQSEESLGNIFRELLKGLQV
jgi:hypothetical protein